MVLFLQSEDDFSLSGVALTALCFDAKHQILVSGDQNGMVSPMPTDLIKQDHLLFTAVIRFILLICLINYRFAYINLSPKRMSQVRLYEV